MNWIKPEEAQVGDYAAAWYTNPVGEYIESIEHNAGIKEGQCLINGLYWNYADMIVNRKDKKND